MESFAGNLPAEPWEIKTGNGGSYQVLLHMPNRCAGTS